MLSFKRLLLKLGFRSNQITPSSHSAFEYKIFDVYTVEDQGVDQVSELVQLISKELGNYSKWKVTSDYLVNYYTHTELDIMFYYRKSLDYKKDSFCFGINLNSHEHKLIAEKVYELRVFQSLFKQNCVNTRRNEMSRRLSKKFKKEFKII